MDVQVILATKNRPQLAAMALQGLLHQTYKPSSVIILDQGDPSAMGDLSFRKTVSLLDHYGGLTVYYRHARKTFPSLFEIREWVLQQATERYVYLLDDDILIGNTAIENTVRVMQMYNCGLVMNNSLDIDKENVRQPYDGGINGEWIRRDVWLKAAPDVFELLWPCGGVQLLDTEKVWAAGGWQFQGRDPKTLTSFEDNLFCARMKRRWGAYHVKEPYCYHLAPHTDDDFVNTSRQYAVYAAYCRERGWTDLLRFSEFTHPYFFLQFVPNGPDAKCIL